MRYHKAVKEMNLMKRSLSTLLALILLLTAICSMAAAEGKIMYVKTANGGMLNMRTSPESGNNIITKIPYSGTVTVIAEYDKTWSVIEYTGIPNPGYVQTQFLSDKKPDPYTGETLQNGQVYKTFKGMTMDRWYTAKVQTFKGSKEVSLRWSPTSNGTVMRKIPVDQTVTVIAEGKNWYQVLDKSTGMVGFMPSKYLLKVPDPTPEPEKEPEPMG